MDHMAADTGPEQTMPSSGVGALEEEGRNGIGNRTETGEGRQKEYGKELTVDVEVEGTAVISMMDILREVKVQCGVVTDSRDAEGDLGGEAGGGRAGEAGGGRGEEAGGSQVRVCRLCIKPGHIFRECPDFKCFRCQKTGHYARECEERNAAAREEEERGEQMEEKDGESDDGRGAEEEAEGGNEEAERELEWRYLTAATVLRRTVMPCQTRGRLQEELRTL
ncbi:uncharacterized protein LOC133951326 isoform X2 [Platichthys flesus]|uniref:uncharacterized protein LOC133951326 isoform X2 n=1 Tax=Platichthys flesus TaxID=8260 RepID=UPI001A8BBCC9|nr:uncharacterized protein LOC133951326 isoform X2 [Platichthys flesus]